MGWNYAICHQFLVADIKKKDIILGYPFFEATNPTIDWSTGTLRGKVVLSLKEDWEDWMKGDKGTLFHTQIAKTTVAQQLAEQATEKKERTYILKKAQRIKGLIRPYTVGKKTVPMFGYFWKTDSEKIK